MNKFGWLARPDVQSWIAMDNWPGGCLMEFFLNVSLTSLNSMTSHYRVQKGFKPATSCVKDQDASTAPARHI